MKPYYNHAGITIYHGDCREILPQMPKVGCVITSPPYNMRTRIRNGKYVEREQASHFSKKYSDYSDAMPIAEYFEFQSDVLSKCLQCSPLLFFNIQIVTGCKEAWFKLIGKYAEHIKDVVVWDKGSGQPAMHESVINRSYELILVFETPPAAGRAFAKSYFKRGDMQDVWRLGRGGKGKYKSHTATFPISIPSQIITGWTVPEDLVLDCHAGTGTTLVAAKELRRKAIGIEIEEKYCEIAAKRLAQEVLF